ncbi:MAG: hypothetical protein QXZ70_04040 [Candidatus Bathyarchaeia archaeon]
MGTLSVKRKFGRAVFRWLRCGRGTAEIVGSVMFLLILLFFFTNVYLWHDQVTREMDDVVAEKMNSRVSMRVVDANIAHTGGVLRLEVTNEGGVWAELSRLWIIKYDVSGEDHGFVDLEVLVGPGQSALLNVSSVSVGVKYLFKVVTTRGNMAACSVVPVSGP